MSSEVSTTKIPLPSRHSFSPKEVANLRESFRKVDSNADGDIDIRELSQVMIMIGENHDKESLQKFMLSADGNGDGKMTFDEFLSLAEYWKAVRATFHTVFKRCLILLVLLLSERVAVPLLAL